MMSKTTDADCQAEKPIQGKTQSSAAPHSGQTQYLYLSRNKHWSYIASYHGAWLSLPIELLQSLLHLNNKSLPEIPPVDPIIFRNLITIRTLVDEAADLCIRAADNSYHRYNPSNPFGIGHPQHRHTHSNISHVRQQRMRELAVSKLAKAYRIDEIGTSVVVMQSASALDDVASLVLKRNPNHTEAKYVHFFHEKIPSRMLPAYTTTEVLDKMIDEFPTTFEYYRTRAMVKTFKLQFNDALKDFKSAIYYAKERKRSQHYWSKKMNSKNSKGDVSDGTESRNPSLPGDEDHGAESQLYFLRACSLHNYIVHLLDQALEESEFGKSVDGAPSLSHSSGASNNNSSASTHRHQFGKLTTQIANLARRSIKDYMHFLSYFPSSVPSFIPPSSAVHESPETEQPIIDNISSISSSSSTEFSTLNSAETPLDDENSLILAPKLKTPLPPLSTYHPLIVESWYAICINYLFLGDFDTAQHWYRHINYLHRTMEGYPIFLTPRSMAHSDFESTRERLRTIGMWTDLEALDDISETDWINYWKQYAEAHKTEIGISDQNWIDYPSFHSTQKTNSRLTKDKEKEALKGLYDDEDQLHPTLKSTNTQSLSVALPSTKTDKQKLSSISPHQHSHKCTCSSSHSTKDLVPSNSTSEYNNGTLAAREQKKSGQYPLHTKRADTVYLYCKSEAWEALIKTSEAEHGSANIVKKKKKKKTKRKVMDVKY